MNFLEIAKRVRQEVGAPGDGPSNVSGQSGYSQKIIDWVKDAYTRVQLSPAMQNYLWAQASAPLVAGQARYDPVVWTADFKRLRGNMYVTHANARLRVTPLTWEALRESVAVSGVPSSYAVAPDKAIWLWPTPVSGCMIDIECERSPQKLVANTDVPRIDERYHMAIVWRAAMFSTAYDENQVLFQTAQKNYREIMNEMAINEIDPLVVAGALA